MRALESTSNAILVTDEKNNVIDFNDKYLDMWTTSHSVNEYSIHGLRLPAPLRWLMQSRPEQAAAEKVSPICDSPL